MFYKSFLYVGAKYLNFRELSDSLELTMLFKSLRKRLVFKFFLTYIKFSLVYKLLKQFIFEIVKLIIKKFSKTKINTYTLRLTAEFFSILATFCVYTFVLEPVHVQIRS